MMQKIMRKNCGLIPKEWFSPKYRALPYKRKLEIRRKLNRQVYKIEEEVNKAADEASKFNKKLSEIALAKTPIDVALSEEKAKRYLLSLRMEKLENAVAEYTKFASQWFLAFDPGFSSLERCTIPLERKVHGINSIIGCMKSYLGKASENLQIIERRIIMKDVFLHKVVEK